MSLVCADEMVVSSSRTDFVRINGIVPIEIPKFP